MRRSVPLIVLAAALASLASGCASAKYDADRGDIATAPVQHENPVVPLTVSIAGFEDRTGRNLPRGAVAAWTRSYAKVLERSEVFLDVFPASPRGKKGPADLRVQGLIVRADLGRNYAWLTTWGVIAVATLGYGAFIGPVVGLPWATDSVDFALETRFTTSDGRRVATYRARFEDTLWLSAYSGDEGQSGYYLDARVPLQEVMSRSVREVIDDYQRFQQLAADRKAEEQRIADLIEKAPRARPPVAPPVAARPPAPAPRPAPPAPPAPAPPAPEPPPPVAAAPVPPPVTRPSGPVGSIDRVDAEWGLVIVRLDPGADVRTNDVLEVLRGQTRIGKIRIVKVIGGATLSAKSDRGEPVDPIRPGDQVEWPRE